MAGLGGLGVVLAGLVLFFLCVPSVAPQDVDGSWTPWSALMTTCSKTCGGGVMQKMRTCSNPTPSGSGLICQRDDNVRADIDIQTFNCSMESCWSLNPLWTNWTTCDVNCSIGETFRDAVCDDVLCTGIQELKETKECNTWNKTTCPNPCDTHTCPEFAVCNDESTDVEPVAVCACVMGYQMKGNKCFRPPPTTPTPRPIPTLPAAQKVVATVMSKTASTVLICFVAATLVLFLLLRIFTPDRIIQMNMEIALLLAHIILMFPSSTSDNVTFCKIVSVLLHYFFTACYMFMFLEALHMYSLVAYVVKKNGMFNRIQNILVGWGVPALIVLFCMAFEYDNYGGEYHCWLQMNKRVVYAQFIPVITLMIITFTLIEAAGAAEYKPLKGMDQTQVTSAKFSQRTNLIIVPLVFAHWLLGIMSEYEQNLALYGTFSIMNSVLGAAIFFLHCSNNQEVRTKLKSMCKRG